MVLGCNEATLRQNIKSPSLLIFNYSRSGSQGSYDAAPEEDTSRTGHLEEELGLDKKDLTCHIYGGGGASVGLSVAQISWVNPEDEKAQASSLSRVRFSA